MRKLSCKLFPNMFDVIYCPGTNTKFQNSQRQIWPEIFYFYYYYFGNKKNWLFLLMTSPLIINNYKTIWWKLICRTMNAGLVLAELNSIQYGNITLIIAMETTFLIYKSYDEKFITSKTLIELIIQLHLIEMKISRSIAINLCNIYVHNIFVNRLISLVFMTFMYVIINEISMK